MHNRKTNIRERRGRMPVQEGSKSTQCYVIVPQWSRGSRPSSSSSLHPVQTLAGSSKRPASSVLATWMRDGVSSRLLARALASSAEETCRVSYQTGWVDKCIPMQVHMHSAPCLSNKLLKVIFLIANG